MKVKKTLLLTILCMSLVGCTGNTGTSSSKDNSGEIQNGEKSNQNDSETGTGTGSGTGTGTEGSESGNTGTEGGTEGDKTEEKTDDPYQSGWSKEVVDDMLKYLGNQVIPYVNLGSASDVISQYKVSSSVDTKPYLRIDGLKQYDLVFVTDVLATYKSAGWIIASYGTGFIASKDLLEVHLVEEEGFIVLNVYYDEPYDTTAATEWSDDIKSLCSTYMSGHEIPYIYLGTANPYYISWNSDTSYVYVYGKGYRNEMVDNAMSVFEKYDNWTATESVDGEYKTLKAVGTMEDGCEITIDLDFNNNTTTPRARMKVMYKEGFNPESYKTWDSTTLSTFSAYLQGHEKELPVIYTGSSAPAVTWSSSYSRLSVTGGFWDDAFLTNAESVLKADVDDSGNCYWKDIVYGVNNYGKTLTAKRVNFDDGCYVSVELGGTYNAVERNRCCLNINYIPAVEVPSDVTDWSSLIQTGLTSPVSSTDSLTILDGHKIPYVYLNTTSESFHKYTYTERYIKITGGIYNPNVIENAIDIYHDDGWETKTLKGSYGYDGFEAIKKFSHTKTVTDEDGTTKTEVDDEHDCEITVRIPAPTTTAPFDDRMEFYAYLNEGFGKSEYSAWDDDIKAILKSNFNNCNLPALYLGSSYVEHSYSSVSNTLSMYGGSWDDSLWTSVKTALSSADWTVEDPDLEKDSPVLTATLKDSDIGIFTLTLSKYSGINYPYSVPQVILKYEKTYNIPENGSWGTDTLAKFKTYFGTDMDTNTNVIPYIYLHAGVGEEKPDANINENYYSLKIEGGSWDDRVLTDAESSFKAAGWETTYDWYSYSKMLVAHHINDDGSLFVTKVFKSAATDGKARMFIYYDAPINLTDLPTEWTETQTTNMKSVLSGYTIPFIPTGKGTLKESPKASKTNPIYSSYGLTCTASTDWTDAYIINAESILKKDGWTTEINYNKDPVNYYYGVWIDATKDVTDGRLHLALRSSTVKGFYLTAWFDNTTEYDPDFKYDDSITSDMNFLLGLEIPGINLGTSNPSKSVSIAKRYIELKGNGTDTNLIVNAEKAFVADKNHVWTLSYLDSNLFTYAHYGKVLKASTKNDSGETVSVYVYEYFGLSMAAANTTQYSYLKAQVDK